MSEQFDAGLRDLYAAARRAHDAAPGLSVATMVARTRRLRRTRATTVTLATAAAVVGVAVAGSAVVRGLDGTPAPPVPPATEATHDPTPEATASLEPTCGADLTRPPLAEGVHGAVLDAGLDADTLVAGGLDAWFAVTVAAGYDPGIQAEVPDDVGFVVARDGVVVGTTERVTRPATPQDGSLRTHDAQVWPVGCDGAALAPGAYDLVAYLPVLVEVSGATSPGVLLADPVPFTVPDAGPLPAPDAHLPVDSASDAPPANASVPVPDGEYLGHVTDVDADAGTVSADLVTMITGAAAEEWLSVNRPGEPAFDGYTTDDPDGSAVRTLPLAADAPVWEWCSTETRLTTAQRAGGVAEWAAAPSDGSIDRVCADGPAMPRGGMYWLDVRGGVVVQVVGQFLP